MGECEGESVELERGGLSLKERIGLRAVPGVRTGRGMGVRRKKTMIHRSVMGGLNVIPNQLIHAHMPA